MTRRRAGRRSPRLAWIWLVTAAAMARLPGVRRRVLDQRPAEREAPPPLAALAQDVREAGRADGARALDPRARAVVDRDLERLARLAVLAGVLVHAGERLVGGRGGGGLAGRERLRERLVHGRQRLRRLAQLAEHDALERAGARAQVGRRVLGELGDARPRSRPARGGGCRRRAGSGQPRDASGRRPRAARTRRTRRRRPTRRRAPARGCRAARARGPWRAVPRRRSRPRRDSRRPSIASRQARAEPARSPASSAHVARCSRSSKRTGSVAPPSSSARSYSFAASRYA